MKCKLAFPLALTAMLLLIALSTGSLLFYTLSILVILCVFTGLAGVLWTAGTLSCSAALSDITVRRGEDSLLLLSLRHQGRIPVAPIRLELSSATLTRGREIRLRDIPGRMQTLQMPIHAAHVGVFPSGVQRCTVEDLLGIFQKTIIPENATFELVVLPGVFDVEPLTFSPGDPGSEMMARATEDLSAPTDVRTYQAGDAMKKIHWKLSLRKNELMVRKFEEPVLQEALVLMDCSPPPSWGHARAEADIQDALLETAASVLSSQAGTDHTCRLPLMGAHPVEIDVSMGLPLAFENLARTDFSEPDRFERVLLLESRRLRKVGCLVVISARLSGAIVETLCSMRRMGPAVRLYLITFTPEDANLRPLLTRLEEAGIEIAFQIPRTNASDDR